MLRNTWLAGKLVSRVGFGTMRLTGAGIWEAPIDEKECMHALRLAVENGVNHFDTADSYGPFIAEELIARALYPYPQELLIATKGGLARHGPGRWVPCGHPAYLRQCVEMSLRHLKLDCIDLYYLHRVDPAIPLSEQIGVFVDLLCEGKIRSFGLSKVDVDTIEKAREMLPISAIQNKLNINNFSESDEVLKWCEANGTPFVSYAPLDAGKVFEMQSKLTELAHQLGALPAQVALAWLLQRSPAILAIPGSQQATHIIENIAALNLLGNPSI